MNRTNILYVAAFVGVLVFALNLLAEQFFLYWLFDWFDMMMHGLGGIFLGLLIYLAGSKYLPTVFHHAVPHFLIIIAGVLLVGFLWETLEFGLDNILLANLQVSLADTISDLGFDILGGLAAAIGVYRRPKAQSPKPNHV